MGLQTELQTLIAIYKPEREQRSETWCLYRGRTHQDVVNFSTWVPSSFHEVRQWRDGFFRSVWISLKELAVITYCEGDVDISVHTSLDSYLAELRRASRSYAMR